jgi:hypothetical protein
VAIPAITAAATTTVANLVDPLPADDLQSLLLTQDPVVTETAEATPPTTEAATETQATAETTTAAPLAEPQTTTEAQPGTPDKAMQKLQQDLSAATRKLDELTAKIDSGQTLTPVEQKQVQQSQRKIDQVRQALSEKDPKKGFDIYDHGEATAEGLVELDGVVQSQQKQIKDLQTHLDQIRQHDSQREAVSNFEHAQRQYAGVNVQDVWSKAVDDALTMTGLPPEQVQHGTPAWNAVQNVAVRLFHTRAGAASKTVATKTAAATTTTPAPKPTSAGPRVTVQTDVTPAKPLSPDDQAMKDYLALVKNE